MRRSLWIAMLCVFVAPVCWAGLSPGDTAPAFEAKNQDGKVIKLADLAGKPIAIFFYPKDFTSGCTEQVCQFRDEYSKYRKLGAVILGVSKQGEESHRDFRKKHSLPYDLLADEDGKLAAAFGVSTMPVIGLMHRQSVLLGADGKVIRFYESANPATNAADMLRDLELSLAAKKKPATP